ncbi:glycosyl hydrolase [Halalkalibacter sp. AB-rgal2]|uniref:glycosyl hydrolase n=1 Tax=Halalkalibacter sp. AB-rgal2 TaxID=3242695 RepID=UPI00359E6A08
MKSDLHEAFQNPGHEFSPIPFWFWNDRLTNEEIKRQIHEMDDKGVNGFVLHPRIGIPKDIGYLTNEFMGYVKVAVQEAKQLGMSVILYDEAMYPSGSAKGMVVKRDPEYASRGLKVVELPCEGQKEYAIDLDEEERLLAVFAAKKIDGLALVPDSIQELKIHEKTVRFVEPEDGGRWVILTFIETNSGGNIRGIHFGEDDGEEHAPPSADLLNPQAVKAYIDITHERYYDVLQDEFGETVIAMFTDEPDILGRNAKAGVKPWTGGSFAWYEQYGGKKGDLPALWYDVGTETASMRKRYEQAVYQRLSAVYYEPLSRWCEEHGIALTGHPAESDDIGLLDHFQIPGQDVVWRWVAPEEGKGITGRHSTAGKCSADAARHRGRRRNADEVLGVCSKKGGWDLSAGDMKWYFDWLFVRGVNLIIPHAFYYSIDGKRRSHERPPDVGMHSSWWPYYRFFSDYIKRLSWLMTDSVNTTKVAVLCRENHLPWEIVKPFYEQQIEFNYIEEALLLSEAEIVDGLIQIEAQLYSTVVIDGGYLLEEKTKQQLRDWIKQGGTVITVGEERIVEGAVIVSKPEEGSNRLIESEQQTVRLNPRCSNIRISHVEKEDHSFYLLVNEGDESFNGTVTLRETGTVELWDAWSGTTEELGQVKEIPITLHRRESIIVMVDPNDRESVTRAQVPKKEPIRMIELNQEWTVSGEAFERQTTALRSWTEWTSMTYYSGTLTYRTTFHLQETIEQAVIDCGEVDEIAKLTVNGEEVGVKMWAPYTFVLTGLLREGENVIELAVTNSKANEMDQVALRSGLIGPVTVGMFGG